MHIIVYRKFVHNDVAGDVVGFNWGGWCKCRGAIQLESTTYHYVHVFVHNYVHQAFKLETEGIVNFNSKTCWTTLEYTRRQASTGEVDLLIVPQ